jgi:hypothetical protein
MNDERTIQECLEVIKASPANVISIKANSEHFPSGQSIINAIDWLFTNVTRAIILEDDILVSQDFIDFMDLSLDHFKNIESGVGSIIGSCFIPIDKRSRGMLRKTVFTSSWGWGTWRDRWAEFDRNLASWSKSANVFPSILHDVPSRSRFNSIFQSIESGDFDAWDYRWQYTNWRKGWVTVGPNANLILNIGFDQRSTHTFSAPGWLPESFEKFPVESNHLNVISYDKSGDLWYKSRVLGLSYSYFLRTKIRKMLDIFH